MKKINGKIRYDRICIIITVFSLIIYLGTSILLKSRNIELANKIARTQKEITVVQSEVDSLTMNIKNLTDYSRVLNSIDAASMTNRNSTVIKLGD